MHRILHRLESNSFDLANLEDNGSATEKIYACLNICINAVISTRINKEGVRGKKRCMPTLTNITVI